MTRISVLLMAFSLGCAPRGEPADSIPPNGSAGGEATSVTGVVAVVGSAPVNVQVVLQPEEGRSIALTGPLADELERLAGVRVSVEGPMRRSSNPMMDREIEATDYDVLSVDGAPAILGEIISVSGGAARLRTAAGEEFQITGTPAEFRVGQKVWVQGPTSVVVQSYGVVRP